MKMFSVISYVFKCSFHNNSKNFVLWTYGWK